MKPDPNFNELPYRIRGRRVDPVNGIVTHGESESQLPPKAIQVLGQLARHAGEPVSRRTLIDRIWDGNEFVGQKGVSQAIWQIRKALGDNDSERLIRTIPRKGYSLRFEAAVISTPAATPGPPAGNRLILAVSTLLLCTMTFVLFATLNDRAPQGRTADPDPVAMHAPDQVLTASVRLLNPAVSPDGRQLAYQYERAGQYDLVLRDLENGSEINLIETPNSHEVLPAWSPDSQSIAYWSWSEHHCQLRLTNLRDGDIRIVQDICPRGVTGAVAWSPDGEWLAIPRPLGRARQTSILLHELATGQQLRASYPGDSTLFDSQPAFSPDGRYLAVVRRSHDGFSLLPLIDLETGQERIINTQGLLPRDIAWSGDSSILFMSAHWQKYNQLVAINIETGEFTPYELTDLSSVDIASDWLTAERSPMNTAAWQLALSGDYRLDRLQAAGDLPRDLDTRGGRIAFSTSHPAGSAIWTALHADRARPVAVVEDGNFHRTRISPDGQMIAALWASPHAAAGALINAETGQIAWLSLGEDTRISDIEWSQSGKWLYFVANRSGAWELWRQELGIARAPEEVTRFGIEDVEISRVDGSVYVLDDGGIYRLDEAGGIRHIMPRSFLYPGLWTPVDDGIIAINRYQVGHPPSVWKLGFDGSKERLIELPQKARLWRGVSHDPESDQFVFISGTEPVSSIEMYRLPTLPLAPRKLRVNRKPVLPVRAGDCVNSLWPAPRHSPVELCASNWFAANSNPDHL